MWNVELNVAGHQFTHRILDRRAIRPVRLGRPSVRGRRVRPRPTPVA